MALKAGLCLKNPSPNEPSTTVKASPSKTTTPIPELSIKSMCNGQAHDEINALSPYHFLRSLKRAFDQRP